MIANVALQELTDALVVSHIELGDGRVQFQAIEDQIGPNVCQAAALHVDFCGVFEGYG